MGWSFDTQHLSPEIRAIVLAKRKEEERLREERYRRERENSPQIWEKVRNSVTPGQSIRNWTAFKGYLGDSFTIDRVGENYIEIDTPNAQTIIHVRRVDFEAVWEVWKEYQAGKVRRQELTPITRNSKYVISILHWMEAEN